MIPLRLEKRPAHIPHGTAGRNNFERNHLFCMIQGGNRMKKFQKRLIAVGLTLAMAVPASSPAFASSIIVPWNPSASQTTPANPAAPAGDLTGGAAGGTAGVTLPLSTSTQWKVAQPYLNLSVGQTASVSLLDANGQPVQTVAQDTTAKPLFSASFFFVNGQKVEVSSSSSSQAGQSSGAALTWTSSNEAVATVSNGVVTAKGLGRAVITGTAADGTTVSCMAHVALKGIDVSSFQKQIDWAQVKAAGIDYAMIRTGYGSDDWVKQKDAYFEQNYAGARANGIKVGAYHYSYATTPEEAREEAQMALHILNGRPLDYPLAFDIEDKCHAGLSAAQIAAIVNAFCSTVEAAGYDTAVYSYSNFVKSKLTDPSLGDYDLWIAHWGTQNPSYTGAFTMWQYGSVNLSGAVSGNSNVDANYCYYDYGNSLSETAGSTIVTASAHSAE